MIVFLCSDLCIEKIIEIYEHIRNQEIKMVQEEIIEEIVSNEENNIEEYKIDNEKKIWQIEIPKIELIAPISEGVGQDVMIEFVGHFENTSKLVGNIGLAAHNRGYPINYFSRIKELEAGDNIIYKYNNEIKEYIVETKIVIKDTDWSYLQGTEDNRITLITCVENIPSKRLCIQAIEIKEE